MAINSLNASSNGLSGLVSGLNTEDFVSKLLAGTQSKIDMAKTQKTQLLYKRDLYRTVNSSIRSLQSKYFSFASTNNTNLLSSAFFKSFSATSSNDKVLSVNATNVANAGKYNIKVDQLAQNMSVSSKDPVSGAIKGEFDLEELKKALQGDKEVKFKLELDGVTKEIVLKNGDATDETALKKAIEDQISTKLGAGVKVNVTKGSNGKSTITFDTTGNRTLTFASDSKELGISSGASNRINLKSALDKTGLASKIKGDRFEFSINGVDFSFDKSTSVGRIIENVNASEAGVTLSYSALSDSFKIESNVGGDGSKIELEQRSGNLLTVMFGKEVIEGADPFSTPGLEIKNTGTSTKPEDKVITGSTKLEQLGLKGGTLKIDGKDIEYTKDMTIDEFNAALEAKNISAKIGLNVTPPRFIFAGTKLPIPVSIGPASQAGGNGNAQDDFKILFGKDNLETSSTKPDEAAMKQLGTPKKSIITTSSNKVTVSKDGGQATELTGNNFVAGKSAMLTINGKKIERNSNTLTEEGLSLELHETGETVITISSDNDKVFDGIKAFMDDYNKLVDEIWTYIKEDPSYKEYAPLTAEQKAEMTDKEIELWEKKSKEGLLRADPTLRAITDSMREVLNTRIGGVSLADLGITTSYDFEKGYGGKLVFSDSTGDKLRESIASDPDKLKNLFLEADGISSKFNDVLNAATTPGKAGSKHYSLSLVDIAGSTGSNDTSSKIYSDMNNIDKNIAKLERKYQSEYSRYWKQFNAMEQMISQMNQQSGWLSQQMM